MALSTQARLAPPPNHWDAMFYYKNGLMMLRTGDPYWPGDVRQDLEKWVKAVKAELDPRPRVGFSAVHYSLAELKDVLDESLYSSQLPVENADGHSFYSEAGVFQVFMRLVEDEKAIEFSENGLRGIRAYDNENNTNLMLTASRFILCEGDLKSTATALSQHVNTIRYRLESVGRLLGENILAKKGYELLSTAVKINICKNISDRFA